MIRTTLMIFVLALVCGDAADAVAGARRPPQRVQKAPASPSEICVRLAADYEGASKALAANDVKGIGDNSVPPATMREAENNNILAQARLTMDLLKGNGCQLPTAAPSATRYLSSAIKCKNDQLDVALSGRLHMPESCDRSKWLPSN